MFPEDKNKIEELKKTLYSRENFKPDNPVHELPKKQYDVNTAWTPPPVEEKKIRKHWPLGKILVWFSLIFFVIAVGIAGYVFYNGYNTISADNVDISITGPTTIDAGRLATFALSIDNKNRLDLQDAYLNIEYPDGSRRDASATEPLVQERVAIGTIASGAHLDRTLSAVFFGLEGTQEKIRISLEYHVLGSTNLFAKTKDYLFVLGAGPISVKVTHVDEVNSGQDVAFTVLVTSNSSDVLHNMALTAEYPFGFTYKSATPSASTANSVWQLGSIAPGESKTVAIVGKLEGQENEERAFKFNVGISNPADTRQLSTVFYGLTETVGIQKPFLALEMTFNSRNIPTYPVAAGETISVNLEYRNNMSVPLVDGVIKVKLDGAILDRNQISSSDGFYDSSENTITWNKREVSALRSLSPGDRGTVQFKLVTLPYVQGSSYSKSSQKVSIVTSMEATKVDSGSLPVTSTISRNMLINSNIAVQANAVYSVGPFKNTGAIPPKVETPTTYTINWSVVNTFNNTSNVEVSAVLPQYVKYLDQTSPLNEKVSYDPVSGRVTWSVGNVKTNTGYVSAPRQVSFRVSFTPSLSQVGMIPTLVGDTTLKALDAFTNVSLSSAANSLTTDIATDPIYINGHGVVVR